MRAYALLHGCARVRARGSCWVIGKRSYVHAERFVKSEDAARGQRTLTHGARIAETKEKINGPTKPEGNGWQVIHCLACKHVLGFNHRGRLRQCPCGRIDMQPIGLNKEATKESIRMKADRRVHCRPKTCSETPPVHLSRDIICKHFDVPMQIACHRIGICATAVKKVCRRMGITEWPHRSACTCFVVLHVNQLSRQSLTECLQKDQAGQVYATHTEER